MQIIAHHSGSTGNLYELKWDRIRILVDPGVRFPELQKCLKFRVSSLSGALVSHSHKDHCKAVPDLLKAGIDCYMTEQTWNALNVFHHRIHLVELNIPFLIDDLKIIPFETEHDCLGSCGFLISNPAAGDKILYATDTFYLKYRFKNLTHLMLECNYSEETISENTHPAMRSRLRQSHFSLENVLTFLKANDTSLLKEVWLLHLSSANSDEEFFKREIQKLTGKPVYIAGR
jgi:phosphoribosyl 1,2-cyclic phosphodiesterase